MLRPNRSAAVAAIVSMFVASAALADSAVVQWSSGTGANNHYYQRIDSHPAAAPLTFASAQAAASAMTYTVGSTTYTGRLAVLEPNYANAFTFVRDNVVYGSTGSGAPASSEMYWVGAFSPTGDAGTYTWVDGTPVSGAASLQIDHFEGAGPEGLGYFQSTSGNLWDYIATSSSNAAYGYVVEYAPVPEPTSVGLIAGTMLFVGRRSRRA